MENYGKKYKEALRKATKIHRDDNEEIKHYMEVLFPELAESKDEKIREKLIENFKWFCGDYLNTTKWGKDDMLVKDIIIWLEKQGNIDKISYEIAEKEKYDFVSGQFIECRKSFNEFKEGNSYWLEYAGNDNYIGRSDNILNQKFHITPRQLYRLFTQQHFSKENNTNEETNAPTEYDKYVDECLNEASKHFFSEGEDKYSVADLFYAGVRCGKSWLEKQGNKYVNIDIESMVSSYEQRLKSQGAIENTPLLNLPLAAYRHGVDNVLEELNLKKLEKQCEQKPADKEYTFKSIPRLLDMIEPSDRAKAYCQKLIDTLTKEGYNTDAKIVEGVFKGWNGEDVPMAVMDEQKPTDTCNSSTINGKEFPAGEKRDFGYFSKSADKVEPKFKLGDKIRIKNPSSFDKDMEVARIEKDYYICNHIGKFSSEVVPFSKESDYELIEHKSANKVEPKFHRGEWVIHQGTKNIYQVVSVINNQYRLKYGDNYTVQNCADVDRCARLWDITKDAKDGDVLTSELCDSIILFRGIKDDNIDFYCDYDISKIDIPVDRFSVNNGQHYGNVEDSKDFHPATKEQRDTLFAKIKEAGYEWSDKKKELKKIEQKSTEWSEEDDYNLQCMLAKVASDIQKGIGSRNNVLIDWLKSLKQRIK